MRKKHNGSYRVTSRLGCEVAPTPVAALSGLKGLLQRLYYYGIVCMSVLVAVVGWRYVYVCLNVNVLFRCAA
jgi:hypothetical protein